MSLHPEKFCLQAGLLYDKKANLCWGSLQGFPVYIKIVPRRDTVIVRLAAKLPETLTQDDLQKEIALWSSAHPGVSGMSYLAQEHTLSAAVSLTPRDTDGNLAARVTEFVSFAANLAMIPCCMFCGSEYGVRDYVLDDNGAAACDSCRPQLEQRIADIREEKAAEPANVFGQLLGAVVGGAAVFLLTYLVLKMSYLSFLTGYAGIMLGFFAIKKWGKKLNIASVVICMVLGLAGGIMASYFHFGEAIAKNNQENYDLANEICSDYAELEELFKDVTDEDYDMLEEITGEHIDMAAYREQYETAVLIRNHQTFSECMTDFKKMMNMELYSDLKPDLVKCIIYAVLSVIVAALTLAPRMLRESSGVHTLRELGA